MAILSRRQMKIGNWVEGKEWITIINKIKFVNLFWIFLPSFRTLGEKRPVAPISSHDPELWRGSIRVELTMLNRCRFVESTCGGDDLEASSSRRVGAAPFDKRWYSRVHRGLECWDPCGQRDWTGSGVGGWLCQREKVAQCGQWRRDEVEPANL